MDNHETTPDAGVGEEEKESSGNTDEGLMARDSTSINPEKRSPIDPKMPDMPPA